MIQAVSDIYYKAEDGCANQPCEVQIKTNGEIWVSVPYDNGHMVYRGNRVPSTPNIFELWAEDGIRATPCQMPDDSLVGWWQQRHEFYLWHILAR